jgi:hypothetical protein
MPGSNELPDQNKEGLDRIAVESESDEFGATRRLLPTFNRTQKAFSNDSPVPNEVVLGTWVNNVPPCQNSLQIHRFVVC